MLKSQLLTGATSVAHMVGLRRLTAGGKPGTAAVKPLAGAVAGQPEPSQEPAPADEAALAAAAAAASGEGAAGTGAPAVAAALAAAAEPDEGEDGDDEDDEKDDDEEELKGDGKKARARRRERARCRAILNSPHAAKNPGAAIYMALQTALPRQQVLALLEALPKGAAGTGLDARMATVARPALGANNPPQPGQDTRAVAATWDSAFAKSSRGANDSRSPGARRA